MSVNEMLTIAKLFLGAMILFLILAAVIFYKLDIKKAWNIVTGAKPTGHVSKYTKAAMQRPGTKELMARQQTRNTEDNATAILESEFIPQNQADEFGPTMVLERAEETETTLLASEEMNSSFEVIVDITYTHTQITI